MDGDTTKRRLAEMVRVRRLEKRLSVRRAARSAEIDRATWTAVEAGVRSVRAYHHAGIERVLDWAPGSIAKILAGGEPTADQPVPAIDVGTLQLGSEGLRMDLERIKRMDVPPRLKVEVARQLIELYEQADAEDRQSETAPAENRTTGDDA